MTLERPAAVRDAPQAGLIADLADLGGAGLVVTEFGEDAAAAPEVGAGAIRLGVHRRGARPAGPLEAFDILLSADCDAPRPWVGVDPGALDDIVAEIATRVSAQPAAAAVAAQVLRMTLQLGFEQALVLESLGYSMLLASEGFQAWRLATPVRERVPDDAPRVALLNDGAVLCIELNRPAARNAFDARMRDELVGALAFAAEEPDALPVTLRGRGPAFSAGGDLDEFGRATDPGQAHLIRTLRAPVRMVHAMRARVTARLHGACIGAGIEVPAAAGRVTAEAGAFFRLPEVSMGLIPGAGGTASIPRRIGRRRACFMAIAGADIDLPTALAWGLVDAIGPVA